jgi:DNA-binding transcriptional LysR family regulator
MSPFASVFDFSLATHHRCLLLKMELMQLEMFVAVVEEHSVRGAAERVFRTQPAVSIAVRKLGEEMSASLFDRSKRYEYRLTQVGQVLYEYAFHILALRDEAFSVLQRRDNCSGNLCRWMNRIHASQNPHNPHIPTVPPTGRRGNYPGRSVSESALGQRRRLPPFAARFT